MTISLADSNIVIIGGGNFCRKFLRAFTSAPWMVHRPNVLAVADTRNEAPGLAYARQKGIFTTNDYRTLLRLENLHIILELTGDPLLVETLKQEILPPIKLIDHSEAVFLWNFLQIKKAKVKIREQLTRYKGNKEKTVALFDQFSDRVEKIIHKVTSDSLKMERDLAEVRKERERSGRELSTLSSIYGVLNSPSDLEARINQAVQELKIFLSADGICLYLLGKDGNFHLHYSQGVSGAACKKANVIDAASPIYHVALNNEFKIFEEMPEGCLDEICFLEAEKLLSLAYIPISSKDRGILGVIRIGSKRPGHFSQNQKAVLELIGNRIGVAIENTMLWEQYIQSEEKYRFFFNNGPRPIRMEQKDQLVQAGKMTTLGALAAGMAHEINQPLNVIQVCADFFQKMLNRGQHITDEDLRTMANDITSNINRAIDLIKHVRNFARQSEIVKSKVSINDPIRDVFKVLGHQIKLHGIELELDLAPELPLIMAEHNRLEQVFINLVANSIDAMDEKDRQRQSQQVAKQLKVKSFAENGHVVVSVSDTGIGIPAEIKNKIFEPFFTTKKIGKGTGLGISISYGIVKDYDGAMTFESEAGKGTTFTIKFPALTPNANESK